MRVRRLAVVSAGVGATAVLAGAGVLAATNGGATATGQAAAPVRQTADVTRGDLVDTTSADGKLTYADERQIHAAGAGTVTAVPAEGSTVTRGRALLKVDRRPLVLMYGSLPLYRTLQLGMSDGPDVRQLERNLKALGYGDNLTVDDQFTSATRSAVEDWQDDRGLPQTGAVDASQVAFLTGPVRVSDVPVAVGDNVTPGRPVLTVTATRRVVHVNLDTADQSMARKGAAVSVELPGGRQVKGTISKVGTVAKAAGQDGANPTIDVDIALRSAKGAGRLDQAPVTVHMESERVKNVLSVPIEALLALREGGFGVEVVEGGSTRVVAVRTGAYGGGRVEVTGAGLAEGMKVGVPQS
jgi:peptidoglycan hydrolase-like protein with peptidoglycan-binding domain